MKKIILITIGILVLIGAGVFGFNLWNNRVLAYDQAPNTYNNLQAAVQGETTAAEKYVQFAAAAKEEGNTAIERLFLATAAAEEIHIKKEYAIANTMKAYTAPAPQEVKIGTSAENLQSCIDGELYESQTMYPEFLDAAAAENFNGAEKIFRYARDAEASHAVVFTEELKLLQEKGTAQEDVVYYICPVCGKLEKGSPGGFCSVCGTPGLMFDKF